MSAVALVVALLALLLAVVALLAVLNERSRQRDEDEAVAGVVASLAAEGDVAVLWTEDPDGPPGEERPPRPGSLGGPERP